MVEPKGGGFTGDLEDRLGAVGVGDEQGIGGVVDDDGAVLLCEGHQLRQLLAGGRGAGGVVGGAEEDEVRALALWRGNRAHLSPQRRQPQDANVSIRASHKAACLSSIFSSSQ